MRAWLLVGILFSASCRRPDDRQTATNPAPISPVAPSSVPAAQSAPVTTATTRAWAGKRLHVWITSCDEKSEEAASIFSLLGKHPGVVDSVGIACTILTPAGRLATVGEHPIDVGRGKLAARLAKAGVRTSLVIANVGPTGFDGALGKKVLEADASRAHLLELAHDALMRTGIHEVELDLEAMPKAAAANYAKLAKAAVERASAHGGEVVVDVHPKMTDEHTWDGPGGHDYAALNEAGVVVRLMTYDLSTGPVPPGPSTRATWVRDVIKYARGKGIPAERLELGLPAYGYDFPPKGKGAPIALRFADVMALHARVKGEIKRDEFGTPHFDYQADGGKHEVWYDDAVSLGRVLADLVDVAPEVRGVAIWGIGRADPNLGKLLADAGF